ncbi:MAG: pilus assembly FimT family protein, partial [Planctomycetota bacterium]
MRRRLRSSPGFTLIELIAVTTIIALVFMLAVAQMDFLIPKYRLRGAAREIGSIMKQARSKALGSGKDVYIEYDLSAKKYWLLVAFPVEDEDEDAPPPAVPRGYVYERVFERELPKGVSIAEVIMGRDRTVQIGCARARITPYGMAEHHIVNLQDEDGRQMCVRFNGFT